MPLKVEYLQYESLAQLYDRYVREFVMHSPIVSICGSEIHCYEHHFVHMVKLLGPEQSRLYFPDEKPKILETTAGFGNYIHEERRAARLLASLDCLRSPDKVVRTEKLVTADRAFIKQFDCSQYPYMVVLVRAEGDLLTLCTGQPIRRRQIASWLDGELLFPRNSSAAR